MKFGRPVKHQSQKTISKNLFFWNKKESILNKQVRDKKWKNWENRRSRKINPLNYIFITILTFIGFFPILQNDLLWNNYDSISRSSFLRLSSLSEILNPSIFWTDNPLALATYFLESYIPLGDAFTHRVINIFLHAMASILLYRLLNRMHISGAFITSLFFSVHPVALNTLFWPGYRNIILTLCLILLTLYLALDRKNRKSIKLALILSIFTSLLHPISLLIPFVLLLHVFVKNQKFKLEKFNKIIPFILIVFILSVITKILENNFINIVNHSAIVDKNGPSLILYFSYYIKLIFFPIGTYLFVPINPSASINGFILMPIFILGSLFFVLLFLIKNVSARILLMGISILLASMLYAVSQPSYFLDGSFCLDESMVYIALIPSIAIISSTINSIVIHKIPQLKALWLTIVSIALIATTLLTIGRSLQINNTLKLWEYFGAKWSDSIIPKRALSDYLIINGYGEYTIDNHIYLLEQIINKDSDDYKSNIELARLYVKDEQFNNASKIYRKISLLKDFKDPQILREAANHFELQGLYRDARNIRNKLNDLDE